jgi:hypothetical protein
MALVHEELRHVEADAARADDGDASSGDLGAGEDLEVALTDMSIRVGEQQSAGLVERVQILSFDWRTLFGWADEAFGGTQGEGKYTPKDAYDAAKWLDMKNLVVKAQVHAGGRGKGVFKNGYKGGVHLVESAEAARKVAGKMLGQVLVTKQTGAAGRLDARDGSIDELARRDLATPHPLRLRRGVETREILGQGHLRKATHRWPGARRMAQRRRA